MKQRIENKLKELEKKYQRRLELSKSIEIDSDLSYYFFEQANEILKQMELLKELIKE